MIKRGVLSALLLAAVAAPAAQGFIFPVGRSASKVAAPGRAAPEFVPERAAGVQPLRMSASTAEPPAAKSQETFEFQAEVSRCVLLWGGGEHPNTQTFLCGVGGNSSAC